MRSVRHLELVRALAEHKNFSRAAAALRVSQPSLTRSLKLLEDMLGVTLFDRAGVTPTVFGEIVLKHSQAVLDGLADLTRELALTKGLQVGELSVAMGFYPADISGYEAAGHLSERHPNLLLDLRIADWARAKESVLTGDVDLALADIREAKESPDFVCEPVRSSLLFSMCRADHPLAGKTTIRLDEFMSYPWVGPSFPANLSTAVPKVDRPCGVFDPAARRFRPRIQVESFAAAKRVVLAGQALSAALPFQVEAERAAGELTVLPVGVPFFTLEYGFIVKRGRALSPAARAFMDMVRRVEKQKNEKTQGSAPDTAIPPGARPSRL